MKFFIGIALIALCSVLVLIVFFVKKSANQPPPTLRDGRIPPCSSKPNCVWSEAETSNEQHIAPIKLGGKTLDSVAQSVKELGGVIHFMDDQVIISLFESALFGFVDDVMLQLDTESNQLQVRSSSRIGYGDMNVNRERIEALRQLIDTTESGT